MKRKFNENFSGNEVNITACSLPVISKNSSSELHCRESFGFILFSYKILYWRRGLPPSAFESEFGTFKKVEARFWPWISGERRVTFDVVASSLGSGLSVEVHMACDGPKSVACWNPTLRVDAFGRGSGVKHYKFCFGWGLSNRLTAPSKTRIERDFNANSMTACRPQTSIRDSRWAPSARQL